jgi:hypothetical protein
MSTKNEYPTFTIESFTGSPKIEQLSFKDWVTELCNYGEYEHLLSGFQSGEIFIIHEYYITGISPYEAAYQEWERLGRPLTKKQKS